jgi:hypothetical protein
MIALTLGANTNQLTSSAMFFNEEGNLDDDNDDYSDEEEEEEEGQFLASSNGRRVTMEDINRYKEILREQMIAAGGLKKSSLQE